jgi:hypothetical protein
MKLPRLIDEYNIRARLLPCGVAGASAIILLFVMIPWERIGLPQLAATAGSLALLYALADLARRRGQSVELQLYEKWGGKPTTVMLRHAETEFDAQAKSACHKFSASKVDMPWPTPADEAENPAVCDATYERGVTWLRENTRDTKKFKLLFDELITHGFRRNLFGLKWIVVVLDVLIVGGTVVAFLRGAPLDIEHSVGAKLIFALGFTFFHLLYMLVGVTEASVRQAGYQYARQLFMTCASLGGGAAKPRAVRPKRA